MTIHDYAAATAARRDHHAISVLVDLGRPTLVQCSCGAQSKAARPAEAVNLHTVHVSEAVLEAMLEAPAPRVDQ